MLFNEIGDLMMVLISYDVSTTDQKGRARLRKVAKACQNHAQRVQCSVFEADLDYGTFLKLKDQLVTLIDTERDSLRFYYLGNHWEKRIEHIGAKKTYNPEGVLIL
jgi:CRISPR-associated protein Cas2